MDISSVAWIAVERITFHQTDEDIRTGTYATRKTVRNKWKSLSCRSCQEIDVRAVLSLEVNAS